MQALSEQPVRVTKGARIRIQHINNLVLSFTVLKKEGVTIENISAEDIANGDLKLILALIWHLILHYQLKVANRPGEGSRISMSPSPQHKNNNNPNLQRGITTSQIVEGAKPVPQRIQDGQNGE